MATRRFSGGFPAKTYIDGHAIERLREGTIVEVYCFGLGETDYAQCSVVDVLTARGRAQECMRIDLDGGRQIVVGIQQPLWVDSKGDVLAMGIVEGDLLRVRQTPEGGVWPLEEVVHVERFWLPKARGMYLPIMDTQGLMEVDGDRPSVGVFANGILARVD